MCSCNSSILSTKVSTWLPADTSLCKGKACSQQLGDQLHVTARNTTTGAHTGLPQLAAELPEALMDSSMSAAADQHIVALLRKHQQAQQQLHQAALQVGMSARVKHLQLACKFSAEAGED